MRAEEETRIKENALSGEEREEKQGGVRGRENKMKKISKKRQKQELYPEQKEIKAAFRR